jgi:hypothetical protein
VNRNREGQHPVESADGEAQALSYPASRLGSPAVERRAGPSSCLLPLHGSSTDAHGDAIGGEESPRISSKAASTADAP